MASINQCWVPHDQCVWLPCKIERVEGQTAILLAESGQRLTCMTKDLAVLKPVEDNQLEGVDDICQLHTVHEPALLHTVRTRYLRQSIYTRVSKILISMNPFQNLDIYGPEQLQRYADATDALDLPPHIFGTGHDAMRALRLGRRDQAIVISGESGAGKTESAKLLLKYVAEVVKASGAAEIGGVEQKVMMTNPVLEAFGNAMTVRNNNSSRFGKWLDLQFSEMLSMRGCKITSYLLEVTRLCIQSKGERCFHVFYQLLHNRDQKLLQGLGLQDMSHYKYMQNSESTAPGIDDRACFDDLRRSFSALGFDDEVQLQIFKILVGILELGNCVFEDQGQDRALLQDTTPLQHAAELMGLDARALGRCLLWRKVVAGRDITNTPLKMEQAKAARDGLNRMLYKYLFDWLIQKMNSQLSTDVLDDDGQSSSPRSAATGADSHSQPETPEASPLANRDRLLLGILDISGFESFEINSLEQLLINLSNEHLQMQFNDHVFRRELKDCAREGVTLTRELCYNDNSDCVDLIDGRGGVLDILDEEITMPRASDLTFVTKTLRNHSKNKRVAPPKMTDRTCFGIHHFAGVVWYDPDGFLDKNADRSPSLEALDVLENSQMPVLHGIVQVMLKEQGLRRGSEHLVNPLIPNIRYNKSKSATSKFRSSLKQLMIKVNGADSHYVRCIKPNKDKVPNEFCAPMVREQLLFGGVLEAVRIRQEGYASRLPFKDFTHRYRCVVSVRSSEERRAKQMLSSLSDDSPGGAARALVDRLVREYSLSPEKFVFGKTKVFIKADAVGFLEATRAHTYQAAVVQIQRVFRGCRLRKVLWRVRARLKGVQEWMRAYCRFPGFWQDEELPAIISHRFNDDLQLARREAAMFKIFLGHLDTTPFEFGIVALAREAQQRLEQRVAALIKLEEERRREEQERQWMAQAERATRQEIERCRREEEERRRIAEEAERRRIKEEEERRRIAEEAERRRMKEEEDHRKRDALERKRKEELQRKVEDVHKDGAKESAASPSEAAAASSSMPSEDSVSASISQVPDMRDWTRAELQRTVVRLTEEREELRKALQASLLDSVRREEALQETCTNLRSRGEHPNFEELSPRTAQCAFSIALEEEAKASRAARVHLVEELSQLKASLSEERAMSQALKAELAAYRMLHLRGRTLNLDDRLSPGVEDPAGVGSCLRQDVLLHDVLSVGSATTGSGGCDGDVNSAGTAGLEEDQPVSPPPSGAAQTGNRPVPAPWRRANFVTTDFLTA